MNDKETSAFKKILKDSTKEIMFEMKDKKVPLYFIADRFQKDKELIRKLFQEIISEEGYYTKFKLEGDYISYQLHEIKCYDCGAPLNKLDKNCKNCGMEFEICMVCKKLIHEVPVYCPKCKAAAHEHHIKSWLDHENSCPHCNAKLEKTELKKEFNIFKSYFKFLKR